MAVSLSRIDVLILSSLARIPMHGYELKLELRYKHVRWWAKCEHGHLYAALKRLETAKLIRGKTRRDGKRARRVFAITPAGRRWLRAALEDLALAEDGTHFDIDLFLASAFTFERERAISLLEGRARVLDEQRREAEAIVEQMGSRVPAVAGLIMDHRVDHLAREADFARRAAAVLRDIPTWGPFLGDESIVDFIARTGVAIEPDPSR